MRASRHKRTSTTALDCIMSRVLKSPLNWNSGALTLSAQPPPAVLSLMRPKCQLIMTTWTPSLGSPALTCSLTQSEPARTRNDSEPPRACVPV